MNDQTRTLESVQADNLRDKVARIANDLRVLAAQVERAGDDVDRVGNPGFGNYAGIVGSIQHSVLWGLANLHLDGLTRTAAEADTARSDGN